jgi:predicted GNAT family acetyltransferase
LSVSERDIDETVEESFPASDAPANTPETGVRIGEVPAVDITNNEAANRFELTVDGETAFLLYEKKPDSLVLIHTEVPPAHRGRGHGEALVKAAVDHAHQHGLRIVAVCPFARAYLRRHPIA